MRRLLLACAALSTAALADEGMWTFDALPTARLKEKYQFEVTTAFAERLKLSALRFPGGSGAFVSPSGLILTNHHVVTDCLRGVSTAKRDLMKQGFAAGRRDAELRCPGLEVDALQSIRDVTGDIVGPMSRTNDAKAAFKARDEAIAATQLACTTDDITCEVVPLFQGARFHLYTYKRYADVRLAFVPESAVANFGGYADNFAYPRFALDAALLRAYENGKPAVPARFLKATGSGVKEGELVMSAGSPHPVDRNYTAVLLKAARDYALPEELKHVEARLDVLRRYARTSSEASRIAEAPILDWENAEKSLKGELAVLKNDEFIKQRALGEARMRDSAAGNMALMSIIRELDVADGQIKTAAEKDRGRHREALALRFEHESLPRFVLTLSAWTHVIGQRAAGQSAAAALASAGASEREFMDSRLPHDAAMPRDLEIALLTQQLAYARSTLGTEHPYVRALLADGEPEAVARKLLTETKLFDTTAREAVLRDSKAFEASVDALVVWAKGVYPEMQALMKARDAEVLDVLENALGQYERGRYGMAAGDYAPTPTKSPRFAFGKVQGYASSGQAVSWNTTWQGLFQHSAKQGGKGDYALPAQWLAARPKLGAKTPLNFVSTLDIVGGSSGSPVVNRQGELVGLVFDGNAESSIARYAYDDAAARTVALDIRAILEALKTVYRAPALAQELLGK
jgi:hypothetical protein